MKEEKLFKIHESIDFLRGIQSLLLLLSTDILERAIFSRLILSIRPKCHLSGNILRNKFFYIYYFSSGTLIFHGVRQKRMWVTKDNHLHIQGIYFSFVSLRLSDSNA